MFSRNVSNQLKILSLIFQSLFCWNNVLKSVDSNLIAPVSNNPYQAESGSVNFEKIASTSYVKNSLIINQYPISTHT